MRGLAVDHVVNLESLQKFGEPAVGADCRTFRHAMLLP